MVLEMEDRHEEARAVYLGVIGDDGLTELDSRGGPLSEELALGNDEVVDDLSTEPEMAAR